MCIRDRVKVSGGSNLELFATADEGGFERLSGRIDALGEDDPLNAIMGRVEAGLVPVEGGELILTDCLLYTSDHRAHHPAAQEGSSLT